MLHARVRPRPLRLAWPRLRRCGNGRSDGAGCALTPQAALHTGSQCLAALAPSACLTECCVLSCSEQAGAYGTAWTPDGNVALTTGRCCR